MDAEPRAITPIPDPARRAVLRDAVIEAARRSKRDVEDISVAMETVCIAQNDLFDAIEALDAAEGR